MTEDISLTYDWRSEDFPASQHANRRFWEVYRGFPQQQGSTRSTLVYYLYYWGPAITAVLLLVAVESAFPSYRFTPGFTLPEVHRSAYGLVFVCTLMATYLCAWLYSRLEPEPVAAERVAFDELTGRSYEVVISTSGISLRAEDIDASYPWMGKDAPIEVWGTYVIVVLQRIILVIPDRASEQSAPELAESIARLRNAA